MADAEDLKSLTRIPGNSFAIAETPIESISYSSTVSGSLR
jgi:hypothetical protein